MKIYSVLFLSMAFYACSSSSSQDGSSGSPSGEQNFTGAKNEVKLITLDPGHFHAALVQKDMYEQIDPVVHVYAPEGEDLQLHLEKIEGFNTRSENPTDWEEKVHKGDGFLQQMLEEKPGNVVVLSGNNAKKIDYIKASIDAGLNVLADKPMIIKPEKFSVLKETLEEAEKKNLLLYDIMTERYEITTMLQRALAQAEGVFGTLEKGTPEKPAISKESVHHFFKKVAGKTLKRPAWFYDVEQQGAGIVDVSTHLVDLILWECFPGQGIADYKNDTEVVSSRRWSTSITPAQFERSTGMKEYPDYLKKDIVKDSLLNIYSNGEFIFKTKGVHGKVSVIWNYKAPEGAADTHYSIMRGTKANLIIRQDKAQDYKPTLYVEPLEEANEEEMKVELQKTIDKIGERFSGISFKPSDAGWELIIPEEIRQGHEAHFAQVTEKYLEYLKDGKLPEWEKQNLLTKYYVTTKAYEVSK